MPPAPRIKHTHSGHAQILTRKLIVSLAIASLCALAAAGAFARELSKAELEGRALARELASQQPTQNFTNTGVMTIRPRKGERTELRVRFEILVTPTNWQSVYEAQNCADGNRAVRLTIIHPEHGPSEYTLAEGTAGEIGAIEPRSITGAQLMSQFAGSDFALADLGLEFFRWPGQKILKHEMRRGRACKVLESTNPDPDTNGYTRVVSWIDNETGGIVRAEAYDTANKLFKEFEPKEFKKINGRWELRQMRIRNLKTGSQTLMQLDQPPQPITK